MPIDTEQHEYVYSLSKLAERLGNRTWTSGQKRRRVAKYARDLTFKILIWCRSGKITLAAVTANCDFSPGNHNLRITGDSFFPKQQSLAAYIQVCKLTDKHLPLHDNGVEGAKPDCAGPRS